MRTTATAPSRAQIHRERVLSRLIQSVPNVLGALVSSADGLPLASALSDHQPRSTAAIAASSLALGQRLVELVGKAPLDEFVVRSTDGYAVIYSLGKQGSLTVLARPDANLGLLHIQARRALEQLTAIVDEPQLT